MRASSATLAAALLISACSKPVTQTADESAEPASRAEIVVATPVPAASAAPAVEPEPAVVAKAPPVDPVAPVGVFFLLAKTSVTTDDGIIGLKPGTRLQQIAEGEYSDGAHVVKLSDDQVTNNLRLAGIAAQADASAQAAVRQALAQAHASVATTRPTPPVAASVSGAAATPRRTVASARSVPQVPMDADRRPVFNSGALGAVHSKQEDNGYTDRDGVKHWKDVRGNWHETVPKR